MHGIMVFLEVLHIKCWKWEEHLICDPVNLKDVSTRLKDLESLRNASELTSLLEALISSQPSPLPRGLASSSLRLEGRRLFAKSNTRSA